MMAFCVTLAAMVMLGTARGEGECILTAENVVGANGTLKWTQGSTVWVDDINTTWHRVGAGLVDAGAVLVNGRKTVQPGGGLVTLSVSGCDSAHMLVFGSEKYDSDFTDFVSGFERQGRWRWGRSRFDWTAQLSSSPQKEDSRDRLDKISPRVESAVWISKVAHSKYTFPRLTVPFDGGFGIVLSAGDQGIECGKQHECSCERENGPMYPVSGDPNCQESCTQSCSIVYKRKGCPKGRCGSNGPGYSTARICKTDICADNCQFLQDSGKFGLCERHCVAPRDDFTCSPKGYTGSIFAGAIVFVLWMMVGFHKPLNNVLKEQWIPSIVDIAQAPRIFWVTFVLEFGVTMLALMLSSFAVEKIFIIDCVLSTALISTITLPLFIFLRSDGFQTFDIERYGGDVRPGSFSELWFIKELTMTFLMCLMIRLNSISCLLPIFGVTWFPLLGDLIVGYIVIGATRCCPGRYYNEEGLLQHQRGCLGC